MQVQIDSMIILILFIDLFCVSICHIQIQTIKYGFLFSCLTNRSDNIQSRMEITLRTSAEHGNGLHILFLTRFSGTCVASELAVDALEYDTN